MRRDPRAWLFDAIEAGERVQRFTRFKSYTDYQGDDLLRAGVERQFEIIGEALNQMRRHAPVAAEGIREHSRIIGFRNILIHGYAEVDDSVVWSVVTEKLPSLLEDLRRALAESNSMSEGEPGPT